MKTFLITDTANLFFRSRHVASKRSDAWEKVGMGLHLTFTSNNKVVKMFGATHCIFALEGKSWRKQIYPKYKANRIKDESAITQKEREENELFWNTYQELTEYLTTKTNCSVLRDPDAEADDMIARFVALHPNDKIIINSTDSDYDQLLNERVSRYDGMNEFWYTVDGVFNAKLEPVIDKKTGLQKQISEPEYILFEKCIRGDKSDNVFSAYPGVRTKGSKNKVGLLEAFADRNKQGFCWNNLMLQKWTDHEGVEHLVRDDYLRNKTLIDLTAQPEHLKTQFDVTLKQQLKCEYVPNVGVHFLKFCGKYELNTIADQATTYALWLNAPYEQRETPTTTQLLRESEFA